MLIHGGTTPVAFVYNNIGGNVHECNTPYFTPKYKISPTDPFTQATICVDEKGELVAYLYAQTIHF